MYSSGIHCHFGIRLYSMYSTPFSDLLNKFVTFIYYLVLTVTLSDLPHRFHPNRSPSPTSQPAADTRHSAASAAYRARRSADRDRRSPIAAPPPDRVTCMHILIIYIQYIYIYYIYILYIYTIYIYYITILLYIVYIYVICIPRGIQLRFWNTYYTSL